MKKPRCVALIMLFAASPASAQICEINLNGRLGLGRAGELYIDMKDAGIINICSIAVADRSTSPQACSGWYSALLTLKMARARAQFYFRSADPGNADLTACDKLGDWKERTPYFLETIQ